MIGWALVKWVVIASLLVEAIKYVVVRIERRIVNWWRKAP